jgi:hypothetical protein
MTQQDILFAWALAQLQPSFPDLFSTKGLSILLENAEGYAEVRLKEHPFSSRDIPLLKEPTVLYGLAGLQPGILTKLALLFQGVRWLRQDSGQLPPGAIAFAKRRPDVLIANVLYQKIRQNIWKIQMESGISNLTGTERIELLGQVAEIVTENRALRRRAEDLKKIAQSSHNLFNLFLSIAGSSAPYDFFEITREGTEKAIDWEQFAQLESQIQEAQLYIEPEDYAAGKKKCQPKFIST